MTGPRCWDHGLEARGSTTACRSPAGSMHRRAPPRAPSPTTGGGCLPWRSHLLLDLVPDHPAPQRQHGERGRRLVSWQGGDTGSKHCTRHPRATPLYTTPRHSLHHTLLQRAHRAASSPLQVLNCWVGHLDPAALRTTRCCRKRCTQHPPRHLVAIQVHHRVGHLDLGARCRRHGAHACGDGTAR